MKNQDSIKVGDLLSFHGGCHASQIQEIKDGKCLVVGLKMDGTIDKRKRKDWVKIELAKRLLIK